MRVFGSGIGVPLLALSITACGAPAGENADDAEGAMWTLGAPDFLHAGTAAGGDSIHFYRAWRGAFVDESDVVVFVAQGERRIVRLNAEGRAVVAFGRSGEGPGEVTTTVPLLQEAGGRLFLWDPQNQRVSVVGARALEDGRPVEVPPAHTVIGVLDDGTVVAAALGTSWVLAAAPSASEAAATARAIAVGEGEVRPYRLLGAGGETLAVLSGAAEPPPPFVRLVFESNPAQPSVGLALGSSCLPETRHLIHRDRLWIADAREGVLFTVERDGTRSELFRGSTPARLDAASVEGLHARLDAMESQWGRATRDSRAAAEARVGAVGEPISSFWSRMVADRSGGVWLERAACFPTAAFATWDVVDASGSWVGAVEVPRDLTVRAIDGDRVLAVQTDALGIERVGVFRIEGRPPR